MLQRLAENEGAKYIEHRGDIASAPANPLDGNIHVQEMGGWFCEIVDGENILAYAFRGIIADDLSEEFKEEVRKDLLFTMSSCYLREIKPPMGFRFAK